MVHKSNVCRIDLTPDIEAACVKEGINPAPASLPARQIRLTSSNAGKIAATLKWHRDAWIPVISRGVASELVRDQVATWEPQMLLCYSMEDYLKDADVLKDIQEYEKAKASGADLVLVAVIGNNRSALSVCRNIVSGCQKMEKLTKDAEGAMDASNVFLVED